MSAHTAAPFDRRGAFYLQSYPHVALALPDPDPMPQIEFPERVQRHFTRLHQDGIIRRVGEDPTTEDGHDRSLWQVTEGAKHWIDHHITNVSLTPCGRPGVRTLEAGETYTCTDDDCSCRFGRDIAQEVLR